MGKPWGRAARFIEFFCEYRGVVECTTVDFELSGGENEKNKKKYALMTLAVQYYQEASKQAAVQHPWTRERGRGGRADTTDTFIPKARSKVNAR